MSLDELRESKHRVIGKKQVKKAIVDGLAKVVYLAADAEPHIIEPLKILCAERQLELLIVENMKMLGDLCGIDVGSAAVALLKE